MLKGPERWVISAFSTSCNGTSPCSRTGHSTNNRTLSPTTAGPFDKKAISLRLIHTVSPAQKKARQWREWLKRDWTALLRLPVTVPTLAALALAAVVFYQDSVVIPHLLNPQSLNSALIFDGETRSSLPTETDDVPLRFQLLLSAPTDSPRVAVRVIDAKGKIVLGGFVESPGLNRVVDVYFPGKLNPGRYALIILTDQGGKPGIELGRGQFEITAKYTAKGE